MTEPGLMGAPALISWHPSYILRLKTAELKHKPFRAFAPGYLQVDVTYLPQMADEQ